MLKEEMIKFPVYISLYNNVRNILSSNGWALSPAKSAGRKQRAAVLKNRKLLLTNKVYYKII
jgi:hypothetical protein